MFKRLKVGSRELAEPVEMPSSTQAVLNEILTQNKMILEAIMGVISKPNRLVGGDDMCKKQGVDG